MSPPNPSSLTLAKIKSPFLKGGGGGEGVKEIEVIFGFLSPGIIVVVNHIVLSQGTHGLKTRNTVKNMAACCRPTQLKLVREQRKEAYLRYTVTLTAAASFSNSQQSSIEN